MSESKPVNPYEVWLKAMPKDIRDHFLQKGFEQHLTAWSFSERTNDMVERRIAAILSKYLKTDEFEIEIKKKAHEMLNSIKGSVAEPLVEVLLQSLNDDI